MRGIWEELLRYIDQQIARHLQRIGVVGNRLEANRIVGALPEHPHQLSQLTDVEVPPSLFNGAQLAWSRSNQKWVPVAGPPPPISGGGAVARGGLYEPVVLGGDLLLVGKDVIMMWRED
jgi:hypothetical protein